MSTKLTYTRAEVQELLDKIEIGDLDNAKTLEGHPASYFAVASEFTSLAESFATEQGRINTLYSYFNNGSANDALSLGGQLPSYYATATQYEILQQTLTDFKSLFDSMFEKDSDGNIHAKLSLWSSGGITAGGAGSGGTGGGISYNRLDSWADYSADKSGWVLSALLGKDLDDRVSALANAGYITQSALAPYALRSEIPSLVGYATEAWVASQGYITQSALSPYFLISSFTKANIKSTLGISDWALASVKPSYAWSEIVSRPTKLSDFTDDVVAGKYLPLSGGTLSGSNRDLLRLDTLNTSGPRITLYENGNLIALIGCVPKQTTTDYGAYFVNVSSKFGVILGNDKKAYITLNTDTMSKDYQILHSGNYSDYALSKNGGTVNGSITAPSFIGNLVGVADKSKVFVDYYGERTTSANLNFTDSAVRKIIATPSMTTAKPPADGSILHFAWDNAGGWNHQLFVSSGGESSPDRRMAWRSQYYGSWGEWKPIAFTDSNVASATKLQTARTIWGQSFDGTGNISGNLSSDAWRIITDNSTQGVFVQAKLVDGTSDAGRVYITGHNGANLSLFNVWSATTRIKGNVGIGIDYPSEALHVNGNGKFTGALTANSLTIGGATITYDSVNKALCINGNMYALGGITAGAAGISAYTSLEARVARIEQQLNIE